MTLKISVPFFVIVIALLIGASRNDASIILFTFWIGLSVGFVQLVGELIVLKERIEMHMDKIDRDYRRRSDYQTRKFAAIDRWTIAVTKDITEFRRLILSTNPTNKAEFGS